MGAGDGPKGQRGYADDKARAAGAVGVDMQVDIKKPFPGNWYEKIGFEKTDWVAYYAKINSVIF